MAIFRTIIIKAEMTSRRHLRNILDEYNVNFDEVEVEGQLVTIKLFGKRNEHIAPPNNGDIWVLSDDSGYCVTNDVNGRFYKYVISTEEDNLFLNEVQAVSLLRNRLSDLVVPVDKDSLYNSALSQLNKPGSNLSEVEEFLSSMVEDGYETGGILGISKINVSLW